MAAGSLLALLDDIATVLDDVAFLTKVAAKKTSGVLGDDLALNAQQVSGIRAERELPVVWAVARGSFVNKLILVPAALLISFFVPWLITPLLMLGGIYLCFEGVEKLAHKFLHSAAEDQAHKAALVDALHSNVDMVAFERDKMLIGASARQLCAKTSTSYGSLLPADLEGTALPPGGSPNYLLSITSSSLLFWKFSVNWTTGTGTLTGPTTVPGVAAFSRACNGGVCIPQAGVTQKLDSLADRLMYRLSYRNLGTREALLVNHSVASNGVSGIRWYELKNTTGQSLFTATPVVHQQGTWQPSAEYRWMGSAAMDKTGGITIGYNVSSTTTKPSIRYAFRAPGDSLGTIGPEVPILDGPGSQTGYSLSRWGDYSTISVDPANGCTMVFTTEYIPSNGAFNWSTAIQSFKLSTCQ